MTNQRYDTILFDLDHTLLDSHASEAAAFEQALASIGVADPDGEVFVVYDRINQSLWRRVESGELDPNQVKELRFRRLLDEIGADGDPVAMGAAFVDGLTAHGQLYPGALGLVEGCASQAALGMVTNGIGDVQRGRVARLGLGEFFGAVVISGEVGTSKPGAAIFDLAFEMLESSQRSRAVMVGDSLVSDIRGGNNAGIDTIWFNPTGAANETTAQPTHEATSISAIAEILLR